MDSSGWDRGARVQVPVQAGVGEREIALITLDSIVIKSLPPANSRTQGMHWEGQRREVVSKFEES